MTGVSDIDSQAKLKPYMDLLNSSIDMAIVEFNSFFLSKLHKLSKRANSNVIRDFIIENIKEVVEKNRDVMWINEKRGLFTLCIKPLGGPTFVIRFKKFNKNLRTSNIRTQQALQFNGQQSIFPFAINEKIIHLNAGYQLISKSIIEGHKNFVVCPNGEFNEWEFELVSTNETNIHILPIENKNEKSKLRIKTSPTKQANSKPEND